MSSRRIGLRLDSLTGPPRQVMALAAELDMEGIEINCMRGELTPDELDRQARSDVVHFLDDLALDLISLGADTGFRFENDSMLEQFMDRTRAALDLALDLGSPAITLATGGVPEDRESGRYEMMSEILTELGDYAANRELKLYLSAGMESPSALNDFLTDLRSDGIAVNYDPANMIVFGHDPAEGVAQLGEHIASVRVRDARRYLDGSAEELALGEGDVPYDDVIDALNEIEYENYLVIARAPQENQREVIEAAREFLRRYD